MSNQKARLDPEGTAKPLTRIIAHHPEGACVMPGILASKLEYENEAGDRLPLTRNPLRDYNKEAREFLAQMIAGKREEYQRQLERLNSGKYSFPGWPETREWSEALVKEADKLLAHLDLAKEDVNPNGQLQEKLAGYKSHLASCKGMLEKGNTSQWLREHTDWLEIQILGIEAKLAGKAG